MNNGGYGLVLLSVAVISLTVTVLAHIFVIARWSGKVDGNLEAILRQPNMWSADLTATASSIRSEMSVAFSSLKAEMSIWVDEVKKLREARHEADGGIQQHEGRLREIEKQGTRIELRFDKLFDHLNGKDNA